MTACCNRLLLSYYQSSSYYNSSSTLVLDWSVFQNFVEFSELLFFWGLLTFFCSKILSVKIFVFFFWDSPTCCMHDISLEKRVEKLFDLKFLEKGIFICLLECVWVCLLLCRYVCVFVQLSVLFVSC